MSFLKAHQTFLFSTNKLSHQLRSFHSLLFHFDRMKKMWYSHPLKSINQENCILANMMLHESNSVQCLPEIIDHMLVNIEHAHNRLAKLFVAAETSPMKIKSPAKTAKNLLQETVKFGNLKICSFITRQVTSLGNKIGRKYFSKKKINNFYYM